MNKEDIARLCHEANRSLCAMQGDYSQVEWLGCPQWQRDSAISGVSFHLSNPDAGPSGSHGNWLKDKLDDGWKYGPVKNPEIKEHPCIVPYNDLPEFQKTKDYLFVAIVHAMKDR